MFTEKNMRAKYITDLGKIIVKDPNGNEKPFPRYAVWHFDQLRQKDQVIECSNSLETLSKYGKLPVIKLKE